ncbi:MAG: hypothetical protein AB8F74_01090 [Saprospiraceae bacterium]
MTIDYILFNDCVLKVNFLDTYVSEILYGTAYSEDDLVHALYEKLNKRPEKNTLELEKILADDEHAIKRFFITAKNLAIDLQRKSMNRERPDTEYIEREHGTAGREGSTIYKIMIRELFFSMRRELRLSFELYGIGYKKYEIAEIFGKSASYVSKLFAEICNIFKVALKVRDYQYLILQIK